jgi:hypothetical protein
MMSQSAVSIIGCLLLHLLRAFGFEELLQLRTRIPIRIVEEA